MVCWWSIPLIRIIYEFIVILDPCLYIICLYTVVDWSKLETVAVHNLFALPCTALFRPLCRVPLSLPGLYEPKWRVLSGILVFDVIKYKKKIKYGR